MGTLRKNGLLAKLSPKSSDKTFGWSCNSNHNNNNNNSNNTIDESLPRSPKDSPPVEKKRLRRLASGWMSRHHQQTPVVITNQSSEDSSDNDSDSGNPKSILKRVNRASTEERRVQFNSDTFVQHIHEDGNKTTGTESLCVEPKDRKAFMTRNLTRISKENCQNNMHSGQVFTYQNSNSEGTHEVHVFFIPDQEYGTKLKMLVKVGTHFLPDEICVKANMSGNKIRVMATKVVESDGGSKKSEPFNERFLLPMEVDPYLVEARLDNKGNLTIEAPLMTHTRRSDIAKEQAESQNKSL